MMEDSQIIVLPSNTRSSPNNTPSKYRVQFNRPIELNDFEEWEVGLREISFINSIKTIHKDKYVLEKSERCTKENIIEKTIPFLNMTTGTLPDDITLPQEWSNYCSYLKFPENKNKLIANLDKNVTIMYDQGLFHIVNNSSFTIDMSITQYVAYFLGFTKFSTHANDMIHFLNIAPDSELTAAYPPPLAYVTTKKLHNLIVVAIQSLGIPKFSIRFTEYTETSIVAAAHPEPGKYIEAVDLEKELNKQANSHLVFEFDKRNNRFNINWKVYDTDTIKYRLYLYDGLNDVLGFKNKVLSNPPTHSTHAELETNLHRGIQSIFVYSDLCQPIHVGDTVAPLLRNVPLNRVDYGVISHVDYVNPIFIPVKKKIIDSIEIMLCDAAGDVIGLEEGPTICVLQLVRK